MCSYEDLLSFIINKEVIAVSKACLQRVHLSLACRHRTQPQAQAPENINTQVFLAGYLVLYHTSQVFEHMGALENALVEAAVPLMERFQHIPSRSPALTQPLTQLAPALTQPSPALTQPLTQLAVLTVTGSWQYCGRILIMMAPLLFRVLLMGLISAIVSCGVSAVPYLKKIATAPRELADAGPSSFGEWKAQIRPLGLLLKLVALLSSSKFSPDKIALRSPFL